MSDELSALFGNIFLSLVAESPPIGSSAPETAVEEVSDTLRDLALGSIAPKSVGELSDALRELAIGSLAPEASSTTDAIEENTIIVIPIPRVISREEELVTALQEVAFGTAAPKVIRALYGEQPPHKKYVSSEEEINSDSDRSGVIVTFANFVHERPGTFELRRILKTIPRPAVEDKKIPLDESPAVLTSAEELETFKTKPFQTLVASKYWYKMEKKKESWKKIEEGRVPRPPTTPLMRPFDTKSNPTTAEKAIINMPMDFEDFNLLKGPGKKYGAAIKESPMKALDSRPANVQTEVDVQVMVENEERELDIEVDMTDAQYEDTDDGEESDSSVEIIINSQGPMKNFSTTRDGWYDNRRPLDECEWSHEYKVKHRRERRFENRYTSQATSVEDYPPLGSGGSGGSIAGPSYALGNASNYTLGDTSAYQKLNVSSDSLSRPGEAGSANKGKKKATPRLNEDSAAFFPKTQRGKGSKGRHTSPSAFDDPDPLKKGKGPAKTTPKPPRPQATVPPNSASGLPEDEVDYDNSTDESEMSIDFYADQATVRDRTKSPGPFSPKPTSSSSKKIDPRSPSFVPSSSHRKEPSWANIVSSPPSTMSSPKPVRKSYAPNSSKDLVIPHATHNPIQTLMRQNILKRHLEQKAPHTWASIAASPSPSPAAASTSATTSGAAVLRPAPRMFDDEPRPVDLSAETLRSMKAVKKPAPVPAAAAPRAVPAITVAEGPSTATRGPSSNDKAVAKKATDFNQFTGPAVGIAPEPDPWADSAPRSTVTIGGFPAQETYKKKTKRKTGRNVTYEPADQTMVRNLPRGNMKVVGANYVGETVDEESGVGGGSDGFAVVKPRKPRHPKKRTRKEDMGGTVGGSSQGQKAASVQDSAAGESGPRRGMGDVRGRGGGAKTPRGGGRSGKGKSPPNSTGAGETWG